MDRRAFIARGIAATGGGALSAVALERLARRAALAGRGAGFYRYIPREKRNLAKGGRLQILGIKGAPKYFVSTSGGDAKNGDKNADGFEEGYGQIWEYRQRSRQLVLHYESPGGEVMDSPDNLTVTPRGGLLACEDDASDVNGEHINRLIGISPRGEAFTFAVNVLSECELAGVCFSPDGRTAFVNLYGDSTGEPDDHKDEGMTCAITGPWKRGPL